MVRYVISLCLFFFTFTAHAAIDPGNRPSIGLGSYNGYQGAGIAPLTDIASATSGSGWFTLSAGGSPGNNNFGPFYRNGAAYQVPSGYTTKCIHILYSSQAASVDFQLMSATATFAQNASSVTGGVYQGGASGVPMFRTDGTANTPRSQFFSYNFASTTWPGYQELTAANYYMIYLTCKEFQ